MSLQPKIKNFKITRNLIEISKITGKQMQLAVNIKTKINPPMNETPQNTALLLFNLEVISQNNNDFVANMDAEVIFEFNEVPQNYNGQIETDCSLLALERASKSLDDMLQIMQYPALNLYDKIPKSNTIEEV